MPKAGTPPQAPKANPNDTTLGGPEKAPETQSATPPIEGAGPLANPIGDISLPPPQDDGKVDPEAKGVAQGDIKGPGAEIMLAGTPENPKTMALPKDQVAAYALIRSEDGMWRAVQYKIKGNVVIEARTKEPDLKALLAAQVTDCLALDMPLFNDQEAPRE